jgi:hypothetical protein
MVHNSAPHGAVFVSQPRQSLSRTDGVHAMQFPNSSLAVLRLFRSAAVQFCVMRFEVQLLARGTAPPQKGTQPQKGKSFGGLREMRDSTPVAGDCPFGRLGDLGFVLAFALATQCASERATCEDASGE